ncbi:hypothetical protein ZIOFF_032718 [Zingiber officinale]|uniref:Uncharacterized protein n=1 Tax=Zingiber officinale TaxID=94328 RepID=A0A8J5GJD5_ZINOF|nr:hypothetical protein ZIOFF_032718 [Zingiber officinale]
MGTTRLDDSRRKRTPSISYAVLRLRRCFRDSELALALRISMEQERARQETASKKADEDAAKQEKGAEQASSSKDATISEVDKNSAIATDDKRHSLTINKLLSFYGLKG